MTGKSNVSRSFSDDASDKDLDAAHIAQRSLLADLIGRLLARHWMRNEKFTNPFPHNPKPGQLASEQPKSGKVKKGPPQEED